MKFRTRIRILGVADDQRGFTLIEALVAGLIMVMALGALLMFLRRDERARQISDHVLESRQNARSALDFIMSEVRMAGSGVAIPAVTSNMYGDSVRVFPVTPDSIDGRYEMFTLLEENGGAETTLSGGMATASSVIQVTDATGFAQGDLVVVTSGTSAHLFEVTSVDEINNELQHDTSSPYNQPGGHRPWPAAGYSAGSKVINMDVITYYVDRGDSTCPTLVRRVGTGEPRVISEFINEMELLYVLADESIVSIPSDPMLIRKVIVSIEAASDEPGGTHVTRLTSSAKPRCM